MNLTRFEQVEWTPSLLVLPGGDRYKLAHISLVPADMQHQRAFDVIYDRTGGVICRLIVTPDTDEEFRKFHNAIIRSKLD